MREIFYTRIFYPTGFSIRFSRSKKKRKKTKMGNFIQETLIYYTFDYNREQCCKLVTSNCKSLQNKKKKNIFTKGEIVRNLKKVKISKFI